MFPALMADGAEGRPRLSAIADAVFIRNDAELHKNKKGGTTAARSVSISAGKTE